VRAAVTTTHSPTHSLTHSLPPSSSSSSSSSSLLLSVVVVVRRLRCCSSFFCFLSVFLPFFLRLFVRRCLSAFNFRAHDGGGGGSSSLCSSLSVWSLWQSDSLPKLTKLLARRCACCSPIPAFASRVGEDHLIIPAANPIKASSRRPTICNRASSDMDVHARTLPSWHQMPWLCVGEQM